MSEYMSSEIPVSPPLPLPLPLLLLDIFNSLVHSDFAASSHTAYAQ